MRYTHHRGLAAVTQWVRLKFAAMNLKKQGNLNWKGFFFRFISVHCFLNYMRTPLLSANESRGFLDRLNPDRLACPDSLCVFLFILNEERHRHHADHNVGRNADEI